jgi:hypothetical protein
MKSQRAQMFGRSQLAVNSYLTKVYEDLAGSICPERITSQAGILAGNVNAAVLRAGTGVPPGKFGRDGRTMDSWKT